MKSEQVITVAIADDHELFREGLQRLLNDQPNISIVWLASNGGEALEKFSAQRPDILLLDIQMDKMDGISVLKHLTQSDNTVKAIMLSMHVDKPYIEKVHALGAKGYLLKNAGRDELVHAIKIVFEGGKHFSSEVTSVLLTSPTPSTSTINLTKRELEVLALIAQEYTNPDIAEKLFLSTETVNSHRKNLLRKLDVKNTAGLVKYALQNKII
jgi:DNA-binding NarL/FixJ family response regulator